MSNKPRARNDDYTNREHATEDAPTDEGVLALYARLLEPLAGRGGRELVLPEWPDFVSRLPARIRSTQPGQEYIARLHRPEAALLLVDLEYGPRVSQLAQELGVTNSSLAATIGRARELLRGSLDEHKLLQGRVVQPPRSADDLKTATSALGEIDRMRATLVQRAAGQSRQNRGMRSAESGPLEDRSNAAVSGDEDERRLKEQLNGERLSRALAVLKKLQAVEDAWVPLSAVKSFGLPRTTVQRYWESNPSDESRKGGSGKGPLQYEKDWLISFVVNRWTPREKRS